MKFLMFAGMLWAGFHAVCCGRASLTAKPAHRAHFVRPSAEKAEHLDGKPEDAWDKAHLRRQQKGHQAFIIFGSVLVALLPITIAWGCGEMWEGGAPLPNHWVYRAFLVVTWSIAGTAVCANVWVEKFLFEKNGKTPAKIVRVTGPGGWQHIKAMAKELGARIRRGKVPGDVWRSLLWFVLASIILYWCLDFALDRGLNDANRVPTYWRAINLTTGVSPLMPLVALIAGLYGWFWYSLQGLALFGEDRPRLPKTHSLKITIPGNPGDLAAQNADPVSVFAMLSREEAANTLEDLSSPFAPIVWIVAAIFFAGIVIIGCWVFGCPPIRNLGPKAYSVVFCFWLFLCMSVLLANTWQLASVWLRLRHMVQFLDRLPLRRTLVALGGFSWGSVWQMGGNVLDMRYKLIFRQLESWTHLSASLQPTEDPPASQQANFTPGEKKAVIDPCAAQECTDAIKDAAGKRIAFARWQSDHWDKWEARRLTLLQSLQDSLANMAGVVLTKLLIPAWRKEREPLMFSPAANTNESEKDTPETRPTAGLPCHVRNAEELFCLVYMAFIQNVLGRIRSLVMGIICIFVAITIAVSCYPFDPRPLLSGMVVVLFIVLGVTVVFVYSQMHRDATLSNLTGTKPGELGSEFWIKLVGFGAGPVLGLVASVFPEITNFIFSWVQPGVASIK